MDTCKVCDLIQPKTSPGKREEAMQTKSLPVRDNTSKLPDIGPESSAQPKNQRKQTQTPSVTNQRSACTKHATPVGYTRRTSILWIDQRLAGHLPNPVLETPNSILEHGRGWESSEEMEATEATPEHMKIKV